MHLVCVIVLACTMPRLASGQLHQSEAKPGSTTTARPTLAELKAAGAKRSSYLTQNRQNLAGGVEKPRLGMFREKIQPVLRKSCFECHGPETQEADLRIDALNPDLHRGADVERWLDVLSVLTNDEMPPDDEGELSDADRRAVIDWLATEIQIASRVRRAEDGHSSFRRLTRYEYRYALQDLLGLPFDFAKDLPPEAASPDGFVNSSEILHMSATQLETYRESARNALLTATVEGAQPVPLYWSVSMQAAASREWAKQDRELEKIRKKHAKDLEKQKQQIERRKAEFRRPIKAAHYVDRRSGRVARASWSYNGARYAWKPKSGPRELPVRTEQYAVLPPGKRLIVELGDQIPESGSMRVRVLASRTSAEGGHVPSLQLEFGWQASNDSQATVRISTRDLAVAATPDAPRVYQWDIPLSEIYPRNSVRQVSKMGDLPSPSEYLRIVNSAVAKGEIRIDHVEILAPVYAQWPPASHTRIFFESAEGSTEIDDARAVLTRFLSRAWRRDATADGVEQKLELFRKLRPACASFQRAMIEVLATVLSSPKFLYLVRPGTATRAGEDARATAHATDCAIATRLSMFLWCSAPDDALRRLAATHRLREPAALTAQIERMLKDPRAARFSKHFVRQWLGMQLLDFFKVDRKAHPRFAASLKEAMQEEPIAFFHEVLRKNHSVLEFLHADFTMANERLARHYGLENVSGNAFRRVPLEPQHRRGGLLTQAGLLAMNSDGKDSHPLKRGIWMLERLLNDPPPPPPPAVPEIDLSDPEIAKMTLKQRIENHRNQAACMSCHAKIDPWGIAFENYDAVGKWRTQIQGQPVDASSILFNKQKLDGMDGLKRFLLEHRQDQFVRAMVHKMTTFALGRPLRFGDRVHIDRITAELRQQGDGLATMIRLIVLSDLFQSR